MMSLLLVFQRPDPMPQLSISLKSHNNGEDAIIQWSNLLFYPTPSTSLTGCLLHLASTPDKLPCLLTLSCRHFMCHLFPTKTDNNYHSKPMPRPT
mmetsp:Transcript_23214/g.39688  ORF Transcript_23214/g.39688 Transcript_23214/m.39688 type:complete len:95 (-) Transcript_23214:337-621(-)